MTWVTVCSNNKTREGASTSIVTPSSSTSTPGRSVPGGDEPVISVDTKKKDWWAFQEQWPGMASQRLAPEAVNVHDFIDPKLKRAVPYGVYDINNNVGWVSVARITIPPACRQCDPQVVAGDGQEAPSKSQASDDHSRRRRQQRLSCAFRKIELQNLSDELKLPITVCHLPPAPANGNKIEHRPVFVHHHQLAG